MFIEGLVVRKGANESKKVVGKVYHSVTIMDETLRSNEGVVSVDVSEDQYRAAHEGDRVRYDIAFCEYREALHRVSFTAARATQEAHPALAPAPAKAAKV